MGEPHAGGNDGAWGTQGLLHPGGCREADVGRSQASAGWDGESESDRCFFFLELSFKLGKLKKVKAPIKKTSKKTNLVPHARSSEVAASF